MARFRLKGKHYLNVAGNTYEYKEEIQGPVPGKKRVKNISHPVPMYLDPDDPSDHNYVGEIIIANKESRQFPHDHIFSGAVTLDMEPLDDEAEEIMAEYIKNHKGQHPIESLQANGTTFGDALLAKLVAQLEAMGGRKPTDPIETVSVAQFESLKQQNQELTERVDKLMAMLQNQVQGAGAGAPGSASGGGGGSSVRRI